MTQSGSLINTVQDAVKRPRSVAQDAVDAVRDRPPLDYVQGQLQHALAAATHVGVVHSSNLCTEITLNTFKDEIAVCNLGSVNLPSTSMPNGDWSS